MKSAFQVILLLNVLFAAGNRLIAREYRGITPFRSTRANVVRLLGAPQEENKFRAIYESEKERIYVGYAGGMDSNYHKCAQRFTPDTVVLVNVIPKTKITLSDLKLDERDFERIDQSYFRSEILADKEKGIFLARTYEGEIYRIKYTAAGADRGLCPTFQAKPESSLYGRHLPPEISGNMRNKELQLWLENFYSQLADAPSSRMVIINYGTDREVSARKARLLKIFKDRKYDMRRVEIIRGGDDPGIRTVFLVVPDEAVPK